MFCWLAGWCPKHRCPMRDFDLTGMGDRTYDLDAVASLRFAPGNITPIVIQQPVRLRSARFVSHQRGFGPILKRPPRRMIQFYVKNLPLPVLPPEMFESHDRLIKEAQIICGALKTPTVPRGTT
jgi:hypothetical protein